MDDKPLEGRILDLEIKIAEQEHSLHELSDMVTSQWDKIDQLINKLKRTTDRLSVLEDESPSGPTHEKPPHY